MRTGEVLTQPIARNDAATFIDFLRMMDAYVIAHNTTAKPYRRTYDARPLKAA